MNALLTSESRRSRHIYVTADCEICVEVEDIDHVFLCTLARVVWYLLLPADPHFNFDSDMSVVEIQFVV